MMDEDAETVTPEAIERMKRIFEAPLETDEDLLRLAASLDAEGPEEEQ